jgi:hypothetical protein
MLFSCSKERRNCIDKSSILVISEYGIIEGARPTLIFSIDTVSQIKNLWYYSFSYNIIVNDSVLKQLSNKASSVTKDTDTIFKSGFNHGFILSWYYGDSKELRCDTMNIKDSIAKNFLIDVENILERNQIDTLTIAKVRKVSTSIK